MGKGEQPSSITQEQAALLKAVQLELLGRAQDGLADVDGPLRERLLDDLRHIGLLLSAQLEARRDGHGIAGLRRKIGMNYKKGMADMLQPDDSRGDGDMSLASVIPSVIQYVQAMENIVATQSTTVLGTQNTPENVKTLANVFFSRAKEAAEDYIEKRLSAEERQPQRR